MPVVFRVRYIMRYIPAFTPYSGSKEQETPPEMYGPPSFVCRIGMGSMERSTSSPVWTTSCAGASFTVFGGIGRSIPS